MLFVLLCGFLRCAEKALRAVESCWRSWWHLVWFKLWRSLVRSFSETASILSVPDDISSVDMQMKIDVDMILSYVVIRSSEASRSADDLTIRYRTHRAGTFY